MWRVLSLLSCAGVLALAVSLQLGSPKLEVFFAQVVFHLLSLSLINTTWTFPSSALTLAQHIPLSVSVSTTLRYHEFLVSLHGEAP